MKCNHSWRWGNSVRSIVNLERRHNLNMKLDLMLIWLGVYLLRVEHIWMLMFSSYSGINYQWVQSRCHSTWNSKLRHTMARTLGYSICRWWRMCWFLRKSLNNTSWMSIRNPLIYSSVMGRTLNISSYSKIMKSMISSCNPSNKANPSVLNVFNILVAIGG